MKRILKVDRGFALAALVLVLAVALAGPAYAGLEIQKRPPGIAALADADTHQVTVTGIPPVFEPDPVVVEVGDEVEWFVSASAFEPGEVTAEIYIKEGQAIPAGVVAGPGGPGVLTGSLTIPDLPARTVVQYGLRFRDGANQVTRDIEPTISVVPTLDQWGAMGLALLLVGSGVLVLRRYV